MLNVATLGGQAVGLPVGEELDLDRLVNDLACGLRPPADVWREHGITDRDLAAGILSLDVVQQMLAEARAAWHSAGNAQNRVKARSAMAVEHLLLPLVVAAKNSAYPLNHRTEAVKFLAKLGGFQVDGPPSGGAGGGGGGVAVRISIDLTSPRGPGRKEVVTVNGAVGDAGHVNMIDDADEVGEGDDDDEAVDFLDVSPEDVVPVDDDNEDLLVSLPFSDLPDWETEEDQ